MRPFPCAFFNELLIIKYSNLVSDSSKLFSIRLILPNDRKEP